MSTVTVEMEPQVLQFYFSTIVYALKTKKWLTFPLYDNNSNTRSRKVTVNWECDFVGDSGSDLIAVNNKVRRIQLQEHDQ